MARVDRAISVFGFADLMRIESTFDGRMAIWPSTTDRFALFPRYPLTAYP